MLILKFFLYSKHNNSLVLFVFKYTVCSYIRAYGSIYAYTILMIMSQYTSKQNNVYSSTVSNRTNLYNVAIITVVFFVLHVLSVLFLFQCLLLGLLYMYV